jgi:hypothetical protein
MSNANQYAATGKTNKYPAAFLYPVFIDGVFYKKAIPSTRITIPILLIRFSPINFSISLFFSSFL